MIGVLDVLNIKGWRPSHRTRFVRHQDNQVDMDLLRRNQQWFEVYQRYQRRPVFHNADYLVSFYAGPGMRAVFYGVYKVNGFSSGRDGDLGDCPWSHVWRTRSNYYYHLDPVKPFAELRDRLVIDWGRSARSWVQKSKNRDVLELREPGRTLPPFSDYLEFSLAHDELRDLFRHPEAHQEWRAQLSAVAAVYLILAEPTGHLYVGSATGASGVWGRWAQYAKNGHAGNAKLRRLLSDDERYPRAFRFSLLQILPKSMTRAEVIERETRYKSKLGSRATGLNMN